MRVLKAVLALCLWLVVALCVLVTVVPRFLDRIYYEGPVSGHFDGARFYNPDTGLPDFGKGRSRADFAVRQLLGDPERPDWPDAVPVARSVPPRRVQGAAMRVTWIGHATVLVQTRGLNILTDPVWSEHAGPFGFGPGRVAVPGVRFEDLPPIDLVLVSHDHYDHLDLATLERLWERDRPRIVTSLGNDSVIGQAGVPARALDWGQRLAIAPGVGVTVTRNHHWSSRWFADRNRALWSAFVVDLPGGNFFFAGDTGAGEMRWPGEARALGPIRFAAIPIGAFRFEESQMETGSHIGPGAAIRVWDALGRPMALPIHWGTFRLSREGYRTPPRLLEAMLGCARTRGFDPVDIGGSFDVPAMAAPPPAPDLTALDACARAGRFDALR